VSDREVAEKLLEPINFGQGMIIATTHAFVPLGLLSLSFINLGSLNDSEKAIYAADMPMGWLLGPRGLSSWHGPVFSVGAQFGLSSGGYRGLFYPALRGDETPTEDSLGVLIDSPLVGASVHINMRFKMFRLSGGYAHYLPSMLVDNMSGREDAVTNVDDIPSEGRYAVYTGRESLMVWDLSYGMQFFQGLFSPYVSHRIRVPQMVYPAGVQSLDADESYNEDFARDWEGNAWYLPVSHELVLGNSFDVHGVTSPTSRKSKFVLDIQFTIPILGPFKPGLALTMGYNFSVL
jgi:hypothetical protein